MLRHLSVCDMCVTITLGKWKGYLSSSKYSHIQCATILFTICGSRVIYIYRIDIGALKYYPAQVAKTVTSEFGKMSLNKFVRFKNQNEAKVPCVLYKVVQFRDCFHFSQAAIDFRARCVAWVCMLLIIWTFLAIMRFNKQKRSFIRKHFNHSHSFDGSKCTLSTQGFDMKFYQERSPNEEMWKNNYDKIKIRVHVAYFANLFATRAQRGEEIRSYHMLYSVITLWLAHHLLPQNSIWFSIFVRIFYVLIVAFALYFAAAFFISIRFFLIIFQSNCSLRTIIVCTI